MIAIQEKGRWITRAVGYLAIAALVFQVVHFVEHLGQLGYWLGHPAEAPWLTPWAAEGRDALAIGGETALGNELLHLLGNLIFLAGLIALAALCRRAGRTADDFPDLRAALVIQGFHVGEHVALTTTTAIYGNAIGLSTFLGLVSGPAMTSYRVWFHLLINLIATWYAGRALIRMIGAGLVVAGKPGPPASDRAVT